MNNLLRLIFSFMISFGSGIIIVKLGIVIFIGLLLLIGGLSGLIKIIK